MKKIIIVHDYLHQFGGAEKVIESWLEIYPKAEILTTIFTPDKFEKSTTITKAYQEGRVKTTWLDYLGVFIRRYFKHFFWIYPIVMSFYVVKDYDLVIISATYCGKNIKLKNNKKIIYYCYTPTRFLHNLMTKADTANISLVYKLVMPIFKFPLKILDLRAAKYLTKKKVIWLAISKHVQKIIKEKYQINSEVVYPPVEVNNFLTIRRKVNTVDPFYFSFGRISFHKRIDLAIQACLELNKKLIIAGTSALDSDINNLKKIIANYKKQNPKKNVKIEFVGRISDGQLNKYLATCKAFIFPTKEDFGIAPIEALASGTPVIALGQGGALEYIQNKKNGLFFDKQEVKSLKKSIQNFEKIKTWNIQNIKKSSMNFNKTKFQEYFQKI